MEYNNKKTGQRINELLALSGKKQKELAEYLGVAQNIISYFIKGTRTPNTRQIFQIATFFNTPADYLLGLTDCKKIDTDLQGVCDYTGLSEEAIKNIKTLTAEEYAQDLSYLLSSYFFNDIIKDIDMLWEFELPILKLVVKYADILGNELNLSVSTIKSILVSEDDSDKQAKKKVLQSFHLLLADLSTDEAYNKKIKNVFSQDFINLVKAEEIKAFHRYKINANFENLVNDMLNLGDTIKLIEDDNDNDIITLSKLQKNKKERKNNE